jgi:hypothetical protein
MAAHLLSSTCPMIRLNPFNLLATAPLSYIHDPLSLFISHAEHLQLKHKICSDLTRDYLPKFLLVVGTLITELQ